jgi:catalase
VHTDIISHSVPLFAVRTGELFLEFLRAAASSPADAPSPSPIEKFLSAHPTALAFVQYPKPTPSSYAREAFFSVNAFKLIDVAGKATTFRYQVIPELGVETLDEAALKDKDADFLLQELAARLKDSPVIFKLVAQIAEDGDVVDDATVRWPDSRPLVELGTLRLDSYVQDSAEGQKYMIFDPIPRLPGIEPSADPLLEVRAALYLISGKERRAAP